MINYTDRLNKAIVKAAWAHEHNARQKKRYRKGTDIPYIIHPVGVMMIASNVTDDEDTLIACLMHDVLEDVHESTFSEAQMREDFGDRVVDIVLGVTKNSDLKDWKERNQAYLYHLEFEASDESVIVSAADKMHNIMSILSDYKNLGPELWSRFNAGKEDQKWWYRSILTVSQKRLPELAFLGDYEKRVMELESL